MPVNFNILFYTNKNIKIDFYANPSLKLSVSK